MVGTYKNYLKLFICQVPLINLQYKQYKTQIQLIIISQSIEHNNYQAKGKK